MQWLFFVACESKRLQSLLLCAERVVKCYRVVYRCFERARQWLKSLAVKELVSFELAHLKQSTASRTRHAAVPGHQLVLKRRDRRVTRPH